jgi:hypothetical protein
MKQKFLVPMLAILAFVALSSFSFKPAALAMNKATDTVIAQAEQEQPANEGDSQVQEEAPVEKNPSAEDKYVPPEVPEDEGNKINSDVNKVNSDEVQGKDENKATEGELNTQGQNETTPPAENAAPEDNSQPEQQAPDTQK